MENGFMAARGLLLCKITLLLGICATAMPVRAQEDKQEPALNGYCPASYLLAGKAVKGQTAHQSTHAGKLYYFADENAKKAFDTDPEKYLPQFAGMCTVSLGGTYGNRIVSDPKSFQVIDGKVYLFVNKRAIRAFTKDPQRYIAGAEEVFKSQPADAPVRKLGESRKRKPGTPRRSATYLLGKPVPDAVFALANGTDVRARDMKDDATLLVFYTTWCGYCKKAMPKLSDMAGSYEGKPVRFVGVNQDRLVDQPNPKNRRARTKEQVVKQWQDLGVTFPQVLDPASVGRNQFMVQSFPTMFLIDKAGKVDKVYVGSRAVRNGTLKKDIESLLGE